MLEASKNRLQFVHHDEVFPTREEAIQYVVEGQIIDRPSLYAEPMVLKYGDAANPNIILAIGSVGSGEISTSNKTFFIDVAHIDETVAELAEKVEASEAEVAEIKGFVENIIQAVGLNADGTYEPSPNELISDATNVCEAVNTLADYVADLERRLTLHVEDTNTVDLTYDGQTLKADVVVPESRVFGSKVIPNNIEALDNGLFLGLELRYEGNGSPLELVANDEVISTIDIPEEKHVVSGNYDAEHEILEITLSDDSVLNIDLRELAGEIAVLPTRTSPVELKLERITANTVDNGNYEYRSVLSTKVYVASDFEDNILNIVDDGESDARLYVKGTADNIKFGDTTVQEKIEGIESDLENEVDRATAQEQAIATNVETLSGKVATNEAAIANEQTARENADAALTEKLDALSAKTTTLSGEVASDKAELLDAIEDAQEDLESQIEAVDKHRTLKVHPLGSENLKLTIDDSSPEATYINGFVKVLDAQDNIINGGNNIAGNALYATVKMSYSNKLNAITFETSGHRGTTSTFYLNNADLSYDEATNTLTYTYTNGDFSGSTLNKKEIKLNSFGVVDHIDYDRDTESIIIYYEDAGGTMQHITVPVGDLFDEIGVESTNTVDLTKTRVQTTGSDVIKANVKISSNSGNLITARDNGLYVPDSAITANTRDIEQLQTLTNQHTQDISSLSSTTTVQSERIEAVETRVSNLESESSDLDDRVETLESQVSVINGNELQEGSIAKAAKDTLDSAKAYTDEKVADVTLSGSNTIDITDKKVSVKINNDLNTEGYLKTSENGIYVQGVDAAITSAVDGLRTEVTSEISTVQSELAGQIANVESEVASQIETVEGEIDEVEANVAESVKSVALNQHLDNLSVYDLVYTKNSGIAVTGGTLTIPKDKYLKRVSFDSRTNELIFVFEIDGEEVTQTISLDSLVDVYNGSDTITIDENNNIKVKVCSHDHNEYLKVCDEGLYVGGIDEAIVAATSGKADADSVYTKAECDDKFATDENLHHVSERLGTFEDTLANVQTSVESISGQVSANTASIAVINGNEYQEGSIAKAAKDTLDSAKAYADEKADAVKLNSTSAITVDYTNKTVDLKINGDLNTEGYLKTSANGIYVSGIDSAIAAGSASSREYIDEVAATKADKTDLNAVSAKTDTNTSDIATLSGEVSTKANASDVYTKSEVYNKSEVETLIQESSSEISEIESEIATISGDVATVSGTAQNALDMAQDIKLKYNWIANDTPTVNLERTESTNSGFTLTAEVKLSSAEGNAITADTNGLYVGLSKLEYSTAGNELTFTNSKGETSVITLNTIDTVRDIYYDGATDELVFIYTVGGEEKETRIPAAAFFKGIIGTSDGNVTVTTSLTQDHQTGENVATAITANLDVNNIVNTGNSLTKYVQVEFRKTNDNKIQGYVGISTLPNNALISDSENELFVSNNANDYNCVFSGSAMSVQEALDMIASAIDSIGENLYRVIGVQESDTSILPYVGNTTYISNSPTVVAALTTLDSKLAEEAAAREDADDELSDALDDEKDAREDADEALEQAILDLQSKTAISGIDSNSIDLTVTTTSARTSTATTIKAEVKLSNSEDTQVIEESTDSYNLLQIKEDGLYFDGSIDCGEY